MNDTVDPETEQTEAADASMVNATARPDVAVAETLYEAPPAVGVAGADDVKLIVWLA